MLQRQNSWRQHVDCLFHLVQLECENFAAEATFHFERFRCVTATGTTALAKQDRPGARHNHDDDRQDRRRCLWTCFAYQLDVAQKDGGVEMRRRRGAATVASLLVSADHALIGDGNHRFRSTA